MSARANFEAACHAALTRYKQALAENTYRITADNTLVDSLLKAWERSIHDIAQAERRDTLEQALSESFVSAIKRGKAQRAAAS